MNIKLSNCCKDPCTGYICCKCMIFFLNSVAVMRKDVQAIFIRSPCAKQVMMFSATLNKDLRTVCKRFMSDVNILMTSIHFFKFDFEFESVSCVMELD